MTQEVFLQNLEKDVRALLAEVRETLSAASPEILTRHPQTGQWSAVECLAHINAYFEDYFGLIERAIHKAKARNWTPKTDIRYTARGKRAIRRVEPSNTKPRKAPEIYDFHQRTIGTDAIKSFIINGERLLRILPMMQEIDLNRPRIKKAHNWRGKYTLGNLLELLVRHAHRHILQAQKAIGVQVPPGNE